MINEVGVAATEQAAPEREQPTSKPLDFAKIDALRKYMLLTVENMCVLFGCSRVAYYNWLKGAKVRKAKNEQVRVVVRKLMTLVANKDWPNGDVFVATQANRLKLLQAVLENLDKEPEQQ